MNSLTELGKTIAARRKALHLQQKRVAEQSGISAELLSRLERGNVTEFGSRKLLALLAVLNLEMNFVKKGFAGSLDELKKEREQ